MSCSRASKEFLFRVILETLQKSTFCSPIRVLHFAFFLKEFETREIQFTKFIQAKIKNVFKVFFSRKISK